MINNFINVFTDGGARGNPGESAIGVYITDEKNNKVVGIGKRIGVGTNNVAEYKAVLEGLAWISENKEKLIGLTRINFYLDSNLVCSQIRGLFKVKDAKMRDLLFIVRQKEQEIKIPIFYEYVPREKNTQADSLANQALDQVSVDANLST
jgi:ribonuclease HI